MVDISLVDGVINQLTTKGGYHIVGNMMIKIESNGCICITCIGLWLFNIAMMGHLWMFFLLSFTYEKWWFSIAVLKKSLPAWWFFPPTLGWFSSSRRIRRMQK